MPERTLEEMVADVDAAMRLTKTELGRALTRKNEAKAQAATCRVKIDELEERMEELRIRLHVKATLGDLAGEMAATQAAVDSPDDLSEVQPPIQLWGRSLREVAQCVPAVLENDRTDPILEPPCGGKTAAEMKW
jgi:chromosome segregation ATPase